MASPLLDRSKLDAVRDEGGMAETETHTASGTQGRAGQGRAGQGRAGQGTVVEVALGHTSLSRHGVVSGPRSNAPGSVQ